MKIEFVQKIWAILTLFMLVAPIILVASKTSGKTSNVVIVTTNDQGTGDLSCMGNPYIKTPNIDQLYSDEVRFTNYHVSTTYALSHRSAMTGQHINRIHIRRAMALKQNETRNRCFPKHNEK